MGAGAKLLFAAGREGFCNAGGLEPRISRGRRLSFIFRQDARLECWSTDRVLVVSSAGLLMNETVAVYFISFKEILIVDCDVALYSNSCGCKTQPINKSGWAIEGQ